MQLCDDDHDQVAYDSRDCPVCDVRADLQAEYNELMIKHEEAMGEAEEYLIERDAALAEVAQFAPLKARLEAMVDERL